MIYYNFPYRGPFEYDKTVISILQYCNEAENLLEALKKDNEGFMLECKKVEAELNRIKKENQAEKLLYIIEMMK